MRTIKELLELMLENQDLFRTGLCNWASRLNWEITRITESEYKLLLEYIRKNRPSMFSSIDAFKHREDMFYWEAGNIKPRIKWIKKHINLN